jgi:hypothetical protein
MTADPKPPPNSSVGLLADEATNLLDRRRRFSTSRFPKELIAHLGGVRTASMRFPTGVPRL